MKYNNIRKLYYTGIIIIGTYAITPGTIIRRILETIIIGRITPIIIISISTMIAAIMAYNRRLG